MLNYSIEDFWKHHITTNSDGVSPQLTGWSNVSESLDTFVEAPIALGSGYGNADPKNSNIILVSAPGAVGKTTLARQIAFETGGIFVDLAAAEPVGANTLVGGLARTGQFEPFERGDAALIIDGLDEARMRVTQESMAAFMRDMVDLADDSRNPIVLLGRTGAVQEAWLWLSEEKVEAPVLEIGYYDQSKASEFVKKRIQSIRREESRREPDGRAVDLLLEKLRNETLSDGRTFSGYSPVLVALAKRVAAPDEGDTSNTQRLISRIEKGEEVFTLEGIAEAIMTREQSKFSNLKFDDASLADKLYSPNEQIARLIVMVYGGDLDIRIPSMSSADQERYSDALENWLEEHPFLDGEGKKPSSAVFAGLLAARALNNRNTMKAALRTELGRGTAANPFLAEFYIPLLKNGGTTPRIPAEHLGVLYFSIRARLALGEYVSLTVDDEIDEGADDTGFAEIEIVRDGSSPDLLEFEFDAAGEIVFGPKIEDVDIFAPRAKVSIGFGNEAILVAPVYIEADKFFLKTERMVAEESPHAASSNPDEMNSVQLLANDADFSRLSARPVRRGDVSLEVSWPGAEAFPWTDFAVSRPDDYYEKTEEALRRMKNILRLFRSHGYSRLAKSRAAIDDHRRTQGVGGLVLKQLIREGILTIDGQMYFLNPEKLAEVTGLNFQDVRATMVYKETIDFVQRALRNK